MNVYFKNLNALRFIAAAVVVYSHVSQMLRFNDLPDPYGWFEHTIGKIGVDLFYVLSGFLITSLMCIEHDKFGRVAVKQFYIRRALRIWPLYYILVLLSLFILPHIHVLQIPQWQDSLNYIWPSFFLMLLMLPNVQSLVYGGIPYANQTWSIGVEEQYYLVWPLVFNAAKTHRRLKRVIVIAVVLYVILKVCLIKLGYAMPQSGVVRTALYFIKNYFQIDCLLIGSYFGLLNRESNFKSFFLKKWVQVAAYMALAGLLASQLTLGNFYWEMYAVIFAVIIINLVNKSSLINIENKVLNYLGKISYSIYMWHLLAINIVIRLVTHNTILIYILSFALTFLMSILSYELVERRFFSIKNRFALIKSGDPGKHK